MNDDLEIYVLAYKNDAKIIDDSLKVIQCGAAISNIETDYIKDNTGDNISEKNEYFVETTGIYWIWKNTNSKYVGNMQYRRYLSVNPKCVPTIFENGYDIITAKPLLFNKDCPIELQYAVQHNIYDLLIVKDIIYNKYPEYKESYIKYIENGNVLFYSNSFITTRGTYDKLCSFIYPILFEVENKLHLDNKSERLRHAQDSLKYFYDYKSTSHSNENHVIYQSRICGYLFERLFTLFVFHNHYNIYSCGDYIKLENDMVL